jgi:hypothetical protein
MAKVETRIGKYGRFLAGLVNYVISTMPESEREEFRQRFVRELEEYKSKLEKAKLEKGGRLESELDGLTEPDFPKDLPATEKEGLNFLYSITTATNAVNSLLEALSKPKR